MTTERLYDDDPYLKVFSGTVVRFSDGGVVLDRTGFYGESGGQAGDTGTLGGERVIDTKINGDGDVVHLFKEPPGFGVEDVVEGVILLATCNSDYPIPAVEYAKEWSAKLARVVPTAAGPNGLPDKPDPKAL